MTGKIILVSGFSGSGKTTLVQNTLKIMSNLKYLKTYTTRLPRSELEKNNTQEYIFVTKEEYNFFMSLSKEWDHSEIYDNYYGLDISKLRIDINKGINFILNVVPNCSIINEIKEKYPGSKIGIFIDISSLIAHQRLKKREMAEIHRIKLEESVNIEKIKQNFDHIFSPSSDINKSIDMFISLITNILKNDYPHRHNQ
jgi:guanylate kinase